ncbi:mitochondrial 54S ribosomal protein mrpl1 [Apiotrichum porosum]|uniref:Mitochondrial 54S ribosomal protein mrpl1 n=1 Tax=Apiotrichum porosum TaxID=105984 RepID=A0A427XQN1_9TREE|nr:mitochondrial 54S ribosomal protein mrpl1 [Apiotrichum porosum]RSH81111.1 mitochondrial 54S ribosomal protein mrpl1 [Apiotrichum porosum]
MSLPTLRSAVARATAGPSTAARTFATSASVAAKGSGKGKDKSNVTKGQLKHKNAPPDPEAMKLADAIRVLRALEIANTGSAFSVQVKTFTNKHTIPLRGRVHLPTDARRKPDVVVVFADPDSPSSEAAIAAGATHVGSDDLIPKILDGTIEPNIVISTPTLLPQVTKSLARFLGPKGLMPNAKRGTVGEGQALAQLVRNAAGSVEFKANKIGYIRNAVARMHFHPDAIEENVRAFVKSVRDASAAQATAAEDPIKKNKNALTSTVLHVRIGTTQGPSIEISNV